MSCGILHANSPSERQHQPDLLLGYRLSRNDLRPIGHICREPLERLCLEEFDAGDIVCPEEVSPELSNVVWIVHRHVSLAQHYNHT